jgi:gluconate kinase
MDGTKHMFVIMGSTGCGKSSVALAVSKSTGLAMLEGDDVCRG